MSKTFSNRCLDRAKQLWWECGSSLVPADIILSIASDRKEIYEKLMMERETLHSELYHAIQTLYRGAFEYGDHSDKDVEKFGEYIIEQAKAFSQKMDEIEKAKDANN